MPTGRESLLAGRNAAPLNEGDQRRVVTTLLGLDNEAVVKFDASGRTQCRIIEIDGQEQAEIVFGPDIYPGTGVVDPNSSLGMRAAAAHELVHCYRWQDKTEILDRELEEVDEALTSLEAIMRFPRVLSEHEIRQLVADAIQRLQLYAQRKDK